MTPFVRKNFVVLQDLAPMVIFLQDLTPKSGSKHVYQSLGYLTPVQFEKKYYAQICA